MAKAALYKAGDVRAKTPDELDTLLNDLRREQSVSYTHLTLPTN